jgi:SAM-dependent methyltransferase
MKRQLEPVAAYDALAPEFSRISGRRRAYLDAIERLVVSHIPQGSRSLLEIGAGDATRSFRIIEAAGFKEFVLLEPSEAMRSTWPPETPAWPIRAEDLHRKNGAFDVITCLWNVLGHIFPEASRVEVLRQCARLLNPRGLLLLDVNHRYNASQYGYVATFLRFLYDQLSPHENNGDVTSAWEVNGGVYATRGHVFTDVEFRRIAGQAGLLIKSVFAVDYKTGLIRRSKYAGSLLYVLERRA